MTRGNPKTPFESTQSASEAIRLKHHLTRVVLFDVSTPPALKNDGSPEPTEVTKRESNTGSMSSKKIPWDF